jgi:hypothetical protein
MKNGKKPTYAQRKLIQENGFDSHDYLVVKDTSTEMQIVHRDADDSIITLPKGEQI